MSWKIEVINKDGIKENHYWRNGHEDDFIFALPKRFRVPKENFHDGTNWTIYKLDGNVEDLTKIYYSNRNNVLIMSQPGAVLLIRLHRNVFVPDQKVKKSDFEARKLERETVFSDLTVPTITVPTLEQIDFGSGLEDGYTILENHELTLNESQIVESFIGTPISKWPYASDGKFLGNN